MNETARKRTCPRCGRHLWKKSGFYNDAAPWCIDCSRAAKREWYRRNRKVPDGVRRDPATGTIWEHKGLSRKIWWSPPMIEKLRRLFPVTKNEDLAVDLGVSQRTMIRKARELGVSKAPEFMAAAQKRASDAGRFISKYVGNSGRFQKGRIPWNKKTTTKEEQT